MTFGYRARGSDMWPPRMRERYPSARVISTPVGLAYTYEGEATTVPPYDRYVELVDAGAREHGLVPPHAPRP